MSGASTLPRQVRAALDGLRARVRLALGGRGLALLVGLFVALSLVSYALDRPLRLEWAPRFFLWCAGAIALGAAGWRRLVRPLSRELPDVELARAYERSHPSLGWRLLSAVQFAGGERAESTSDQLAAEVVEAASSAARDLEPGRVVPSKPVFKRLGVAFGFALLFGVLCAQFPAEASTWAQRNLLLSRTARWPQDTYLQLESLNGQPPVAVEAGQKVRFAIARGADVELIVGVERGLVPKRVYLHAEGLPGSEAPLPFDDMGEGRFRLLLERVPVSFEFTIEGGDSTLGPYVLDAIKPPYLKSLKLQVTPPAYTGKPARELTLQSGNLSFPVGTELLLEATSSKALARAWVTQSIRREAVSLEATLVSGGGEGERTLRVRWTVEENGHYTLGLVDTQGAGLEVPPSFGVVAIPDRAPQARLELTGVGLNVTPEADLGYLVGADDDYGLTGGALVVVPSGRPKPEAPKDEDPKNPKPPKKPKKPKKVIVDTERRVELAGLAGKEGKAGKAGTDKGTFALEGLKLVPKMAVTITSEARDNDPRGKKAGRSPSIQLRIVSPERLLNELLRRLYEERQQLERMARDEDSHARSLASQDEQARTRGVPFQRDVVKVVRRSAERVERVVVEMISNKILDKVTWNRLRVQVIDALKLAITTELSQALATAAEAESAAVGTARTEACESASDAARDVAVRLRLIAEAMGRIEELAEIVAQLKRIIRKQRDLMEKTREQK